MAKKKAVPQYRIHNTVRKVLGRLTRAKMARRTRMNMLLGGGLIRIPRGRYVQVTESMVRRLLAELVQKESEGSLEVTTPDGRRVDLKTLKPFEALKKMAPPAHPPQDSAADDKTYEHGVGVGMPTVSGGKAQSEEVKVPEVLNTAIPEGTEDLKVIAQAVYNSFSKKDLEGFMEEYEVTDGSGNKMDLATRLVEAGLRLENGD